MTTEVGELAPRQDELQSLKAAFDHADGDSNGKIDFLEFATLLEKCGMNIGTAQAQFGFQAIDTDNDGMIELDEFIEWWSAN